MKERPIHFFSDGIRLEGSLYLPDSAADSTPKPRALVSCSGYQGFNSFYPRLFAEALTRHGYVCFGFDYRGFGKSQGKRGRVVLQEQVTDILYATTCLLMQEELGGDSVGLIGWGMGAALVLQAAARDPRVDRLAALNGFYVGRRWLAAVHGRETLRSILREVDQDRRRRVRGEASMEVEAFAHYPLDPATRKEVEVELARKPGFGHPVTVQFTDSLLQLNAEESTLSLEGRPVLVAHGRDNRLHPLSEATSLLDRLSEPKQFYEIRGAHNDFMYGDHPEFLELADRLSRFFEGDA